jgi:hypothetical protein
MDGLLTYSCPCGRTVWQLERGDLPIDTVASLTKSCDHCLGLLTTHPQKDWPYGVGKGD